jgi:predicted PurR-regulated permease PerM
MIANDDGREGPERGVTTERIMLGLLLAGVAYGCIAILLPFLSAIVWAAILTFTTWPLYKRLRQRLRPSLAALTMMLCSAVAILVPLALLASAGVTDVPETIAYLNGMLIEIARSRPAPSWLGHVPLVGGQMVNAYRHWSQDLGALSQTLQPYAGAIAQYILTVLLKIASGLLEVGVALFVALFFWINGDALGRTLVAVLERIAGDYARRLITIIGATIRGTVYGILGTAIVQGVLTGIGFVIVGVPSPVLLAGVAAFLAVFPIGAPLVWIPAAIWLALTHHLGRGLFLAGYGVLFISGADHLIRPIFISRGAQLPYLLTVLGVLGGVVTFGGLGIFLGPVLLGVGFTLTAEFASGRRNGTQAQTDDLLTS